MAKANVNSFSMILKSAMLLSLFVMATMVESRAIVDTFAKTKPNCVDVVGVKSGDTCIDIANTFKLSIAEFDLLNPNLNCKTLFVAVGFQQKAESTLACDQVVSVQNGDTCLSIATAFKLSTQSFGLINPNLNCNALFVGQWLCVDGTVTWSLEDRPSVKTSDSSCMNKE